MNKELDESKPRHEPEASRKPTMQGQALIPLWRQMLAVAQVTAGIRAGRSGADLMPQVPEALRPGVQALAFHVWRNLGRALALRALLAHRIPAAPVDTLLCSALALLWDQPRCPYDSHTLVNQTVEAAKRNPVTFRHASFINGCLRRFMREQDALIAATQSDPSARWNHPLWWIQRLQRNHPCNWEAILQAANEHPPMVLRVNLRKTTPVHYQARLTSSGIGATLLPSGAIRLERACPVAQLPGFEHGWVSVQDAAAQLAAPLLLQHVTGRRVLDACAAPGGKTAHLLELRDLDVTALEIDPVRLARIEETLGRLGLQANIKRADAAQPDAWWDGVAFDAILLDAPCSASGIVRRHPDVRWLRRESDIGQLAHLQRKLLDTLWPLLRPGGHLLYCTCSVFTEEGEEQVQAFLAHNTDAVLLPSPGHLLPGHGNKSQGLPDNVGCDYDGFYYALLEKQLD